MTARLGRTLCLPALLLATPALAQNGAAAEEAAVRHVVESAYVVGIHTTRDAAAIRAGFHPDFVMTAIVDGQVRTITIEEWIGRMKLGERNPAEVRHEFEAVDITGRTATAKLQLYIDGRHRFTDYLGLYRFEDGWKIVNKIFQPH